MYFLGDRNPKLENQLIMALVLVDGLLDCQLGGLATPEFQGEVLRAEIGLALDSFLSGKTLDFRPLFGNGSSLIMINRHHS